MCKIIINHSQIIKLKKEIEHRVPIRILIEILFIYIDLKYKYLIFYNIIIIILTSRISLDIFIF